MIIVIKLFIARSASGGLGIATFYESNHGTVALAGFRRSQVKFS